MLNSSTFENKLSPSSRKNLVEIHVRLRKSCSTSFLDYWNDETGIRVVEYLQKKSTAKNWCRGRSSPRALHGEVGFNKIVAGFEFKHKLKFECDKNSTRVQLDLDVYRGKINWTDSRTYSYHSFGMDMILAADNMDNLEHACSKRNRSRDSVTIRHIHVRILQSHLTKEKSVLHLNLSSVVFWTSIKTEQTARSTLSWFSYKVSCSRRKGVFLLPEL